jgi:hypothetical protein
MAITAVDQGGGTIWKLGTAVSSTTITCAYGTALTPGSLLVAVFALSGGAEPTAALTSISDGTQTWTSIAGASTSEPNLSRGIAIAYFQNNALSTTPTVTVTYPSAVIGAVWIAEFLGVATASAHEGSAESLAGGAGTIVMTGQSIAVASTALMVSAANYYPDNSSNMVAGAGYTKRYDATPASMSTYPFCIQDNVSGTGTQSVAWGNSGDSKTYWIGVAAAFKAAGGAGTTRGMPFGSRSTVFNGGRLLRGPIN